MSIRQSCEKELAQDRKRDEGAHTSTLAREHRFSSFSLARAPLFTNNPNKQLSGLSSFRATINVGLATYPPDCVRAEHLPRADAID